MSENGWFKTTECLPPAEVLVLALIKPEYGNGTYRYALMKRLPDDHDWKYYEFEIEGEAEPVRSSRCPFWQPLPHMPFKEIGTNYKAED